MEPIPDMHNQDPVQRRLDTLELKACDSEDLLDQLNMTVYRQQQFDSLLQQLALLRQQFPDATGPQPGRNARDELPLLSCRFLRQSSYLGLLRGKLLGTRLPRELGQQRLGVFHQHPTLLIH